MIPDMTMRGNELLRLNRGWLLALGLVLFVLGLIALTLSFATTLASVLMLGVLLLIAGGFEIGNAFRHRDTGGFWLHLFSGVLDLVVGALLVAFPAIGAAGITMMLAIFFLVGGPVRIVVALTSKLPNRGWAVASGLIDFMLGLILLWSWPESAFWLIGTLVGVALIFRGVWWASYAISLYQRPKLSDGSLHADQGDLKNGTNGPIMGDPNEPSV